MANALLNAWQTNNDVNLAHDQAHRMNYVTQDPYGDLRNQMIPALLGNYNTALSNRNAGPRLGSYLGAIGGGGPMRMVSENPIWDQNQIQQRVNQGRSSATQAMDTDIRNQGRALSTRGFATANSPIAMAMAEQRRGLAMAGNARMENDLRWNAALGNAEHVQRAEMANASNQIASNAQNLQARLAGVNAWESARNRYDQINDPNQYMSQLLNFLQIARPQRELATQFDDDLSGWKVDRRSMA